MARFLKESWLYIILFAAIGLLSGYMSNIKSQNQYLQAQVSDLKEASNVAALKKAYYRADSMLSNKNQNKVDVNNSYTKWMKAKEMSEYFFNESDGKFKKNWGMFLVTEAMRQDINPYIVYEVLKVETGGTFNPELIGPPTKYGQAYGMAQFMENTAPWIADMAGLPYQKDKLFNPYYAIQLSIVYLHFLYEHYGNWNKALTAYHRGMYGMEAYIQKHGHSKSNYALMIRNHAKQQK